MKISLLDIFVCPLSKGTLTAHLFKSNHDNTIVETGVLSSKEGRVYPIVKGIPRLFEGSWHYYKSEFNDFSEEIINMGIDVELNMPSTEFNKFYEPTLKRFNKEWGAHKLKGKTWGFTQQERTLIYRKYMQLENDHYLGKLFLDVGAGTGQLTVTLAKELKGTFIGMDLTPSIEKGQQLKNEINATGEQIEAYFVQANLMNPPIVSETFDYVHASGVLHHTPNTKDAFMAVENCVKKQGKYGVWLYRDDSPETDINLPLIPFVKNPKFALKRGIRKRTTKMNPKVLFALTKGYVSYFHFFYKMNEYLRGKKHDQTISERVTSIYDALAPEFDHMHNFEEVSGWFTEKQYTNLILTDQENTNGFNVVGTKS
jgi:ubiquinone/menaquinone biosynthesis C-methylase UbiE/uncharacterized protein YbaR (Trm112 family)